MKLFLPLAVLMSLLMGGCETFYGPIVQNNTGTSIELWTDYINGKSSYIRLAPGTALWQGKPGFIPERIVILQSGQRIEFDKTYLQALLAPIESKGGAVILFDGTTLDLVTMAEAKRRKLR